MEDSKTRFSARADDYKKFRPTYPPDLIEFIRENCPVKENWSIADIGSGTGISTKLLLDGFKCSVYAVEPNSDMQKAAKESLQDNPLFHCVNGCAESTCLPDKTIDIVTAFQAFHWFDKPKAKIEFWRILKQPKWVLFVWNDRATKGKPFLEAYEELLHSMPEYCKVSHKNISSDLVAGFLGDKDMKTAHFPQFQVFNFEGLKGRLFSSSYTPKEGTEDRLKVTAKLKELFDIYNTGGMVRMEYRTDVYIGRLHL
ncbi:MAG TPA: SAM-dependent methyltransferase [Lentisphaeria bacterium]|nr:MAG: hypothetical protein A2X47_02195 [Lentisphaerae bacterium GWF2_38_69]HBM16751.1 SAM-dependent methyltransferase [Lentisphaeria bacterium]